MIRSLLGISLLTLLPATASAQAVPQTRQGFGISFGIGTGSGKLDCSACSSDRENGLSGYLRIGGYVHPNLMVAGETNGWSKNVDGVDITGSFISAVLQYYPKVESGFYVKGGVGIGGGGATDGTDEIKATGMGINLGLGYDWRVTRNFSLTPYANYLRSLGAAAKFNGAGIGEDLNVDVLQVGLGFTWH